MGDMKFQAASENDNHNNNAKGIVWGERENNKCKVIVIIGGDYDIKK
jgi:hypothetical protein